MEMRSVSPKSSEALDKLVSQWKEKKMESKIVTGSRVRCLSKDAFKDCVGVVESVVTTGQGIIYYVACTGFSYSRSFSRDEIELLPELPTEPPGRLRFSIESAVKENLDDFLKKVFDKAGIQ